MERALLLGIFVSASLYIASAEPGIFQINKWATTWYFGTYIVSHCRSSKAQASLCNCAESPEPSLLAYMKYGCRFDQSLDDVFVHTYQTVRLPLYSTTNAYYCDFY